MKMIFDSAMSWLVPPIGEFPGVVQGDLGKAIDSGSFERTGKLNSPPRVLLAALTHLK